MARLSNKPPRYKFFLNPYQDMRCTRCPKCEGKTRLRKLPLLIHVEPANLLALNKTCRYCPYCDLLIAHQDEIEAFLAAFFGERKPEVVGKDYLVVGTLDRADWKESARTPIMPRDMLARVYEFKEVLHFRVTGGWMPRDQAGASPPPDRPTH
ncbi:MAG: hypothetical protein HY331_14300 [Chloroflexi bacterium]|nr:hypothetical protein [Chloroflexota bacterium]